MKKLFYAAALTATALIFFAFSAGAEKTTAPASGTTPPSASESNPSTSAPSSAPPVTVSVTAAATNPTESTPVPYVRVVVSGLEADSVHYVDLLFKDSFRDENRTLYSGEALSPGVGLTRLCDWQFKLDTDKKESYWSPFLLGRSGTKLDDLRGVKLLDGSYLHVFSGDEMKRDGKDNFRIIVFYGDKLENAASYDIFPKSDIKDKPGFPRDGLEITVSFSVSDKSYAYTNQNWYSFSSIPMHIFLRFLISLVVIAITAQGFGIISKWKVWFWTNFFLQAGMSLAIYFAEQRYGILGGIICYGLATVGASVIGACVYCNTFKEKAILQRILFSAASNFTMFGIGSFMLILKIIFV